MRISILGLVFLASLVLFQGCTCCPYYNHMFNAERAWQEAEAMRKARQDSLPADTTPVTMKERIKYDRVIEKCSRTLERFPDDVKQKPRAVFLIAESFRRKGDYAKAVIKYDEFERYFSDHDSMPAVEFQRSWCLYKNRDFAVARFALDRVLKQGESHAYYLEGLNLLALLEEHSNMPGLAIEALEKVLASKSGTPFMRAKIHMRLGELYFKQEMWKESRIHYTDPELKALDPREKLIASYQAAECLVALKQYSEAAQEIFVLEKDPNVLPMQVVEYKVRRGEVLYLAEQSKVADSLLLSVAKNNPRSVQSARAWYAMGDYAQMKRKDYSNSILHYDSCWSSGPGTEWGRNARSRADALRNLVRLQNVKNDSGSVRTRTAAEEFQIAELFLFKLSEIDSALKVLDRLVDSGGASQKAGDSTLLQRAAYARAFLFDEFKKDSVRSDSLYRDVVSRFPGTAFAKQAQVNLGVRVTERTQEDLAHDAFLQAESLYTSIQYAPVDSITLIDSIFAQAMRAYDSVWIQYPGTEYAGRALYAKAWLSESEAADVETARKHYEILRTQYGITPWGELARNKLNPRLVHSDKELDRLRRRVQQNNENAERLREQYEQEQKRKREEERKQVDQGTAVDEVLQNDYNTLYDFQ